MIEYFNILFSDEVEEFLDNLDVKIRNKITYNVDRARFTLDPKLFKKLTKEIWEFRTIYGSIHYRLLAFWDKRDDTNTIVVATHGIIKKTKKIPKEEIVRAMKIREYYFTQKI
jgi:phage-related protein